jgi:eukaryotic-like serine/threonine-protein kinase
MPRFLDACASPRRSLAQEVSDTLPSLLLDSSDRETADHEPSQTDCLSEDEVLNFCDGQLALQKLRRVDEHLSQCSLCSCLVADTLGDLVRPSTPHALFPLVPFVYAPGTRVAGRYVIRRLIGRGGMGEVYEAFDLRRERAVALKTVLATRCDSRQAMARLKLELNIGRRIHHPNVCRAYETGTHEDGGAVRMRFITMDLVEGETLGQRLRTRGALPTPEARAVARQVLQGLAAAHAQGVLHLDVKSDNVMLRDEPGGLHAVLIDFGLARCAPSGEPASTGRRHPAGTVSYMAPEQVLQQPIGPATDIFGFGVVSFELLTGRHPVTLQSGNAMPPRRLRSAELPLHPARAAAGISPDVDRFVAACTGADRERRFPDAATALEQLDRLWR